MLAATGEDAARTIWNEAVDALADALRIGITLHDPDVIVLGGGMALAAQSCSHHSPTRYGTE